MRRRVVRLLLELSRCGRGGRRRRGVLHDVLEILIAGACGAGRLAARVQLDRLAALRVAGRYALRVGAAIRGVASVGASGRGRQRAARREHVLVRVAQRRVDAVTRRVLQAGHARLRERVTELLFAKMEH